MRIIEPGVKASKLRHSNSHRKAIERNKELAVKRISKEFFEKFDREYQAELREMTMPIPGQPGFWKTFFGV